MGAPLFRLSSHPVLAQIAWARHDAEAAHDEIEQAMTMATRFGLSLPVRNAKALRARFWLARNQLALARQWADECGLDPYAPPEYERQQEHLTVVRLLVAEGRPDVALRLLDGIQEKADAAERARDVLETLILRALAAHAENDPDQAAVALDRALVFGAAEGYVRIFVDEGPRIIPLLRQAAARGRHRDYAQRLLAALDAGAAAMPEQTGLLDPLSEREVEVLRLVATGHSNRAIAEGLYISVPTVKKHLSNIMGKLQVTNRTQAVDQARRLDLL
jgi:LuxR family maltose regulon positive regulatory protein